jgi:hypothetical protein
MARAMEHSMRTALAWLILCGPAFGAPISENYLCVQGHEQEATTKLQSIVKDAIINFFRDRNIAINASTVKINLASSTLTGTSLPPYLSFTGNAGSSGLTSSSLAATVTGQDGTKFNILLSSGSNDQDSAEYRIIRTQRGFDREGNAVDQHCMLDLFDSGDSEATRTMLIVNAGSGHVLGSIHLPARISLY